MGRPAVPTDVTLVSSTRDTGKSQSGQTGTRITRQPVRALRAGVQGALADRCVGAASTVRTTTMTYAGVEPPEGDPRQAFWPV